MYEFTQMVKTGPYEYLSTNKIDVIYYVAGITNNVLQYFTN